MKKLKPTKNLIPSKPLTKENVKKFFSFPDFNSVQKKCYNSIINKNSNCIISAPTASGKTVLFELGLIKNFGISNSEKNKIAIYLSPMKALCKEKLTDWNLKFKKFWKNFLIQEITGDTSINFENRRDKNFRIQKKFYEEKENIIKEGIIVMTPEKLNLILRKWKEYKLFINKISLIMIDEIHTIDDESRGVLLESTLTRLLVLKKMPEFLNCFFKNIRILALSATLKNIEDFAKWLEVPNDCVFTFDESYRPVQLDKIVLGFIPKKNPFLFDLSLNYRISDVIKKYGEKKPTLVFVSTQKSTVKTCKDIIQNGELRFLINNEEHLRKLSQRV